MSSSRVHMHPDRRPPADRLGDRHRLGDDVGIGDRPAAEAAAGHHHVQLDLLRRHPRDAGRDRLVEVGHLVAAPDLEQSILQPRHRVERLHRGVGEVGELEARLDDLGRTGQGLVHVTILPGDGRLGAVRQLAIMVHQLGAAAHLRRAQVPLDLERLAALDRRPHVLGDHRDALRDLDDIDHARDLACGGGVERPHLAAERRRVRDDGGEQARQLHVDRVALPAGRLGRRYRGGAGSGCRYSDHCAGCFSTGVGWRCQLGRGLGELAERRLFADCDAQAMPLLDGDLGRQGRPTPSAAASTSIARAAAPAWR